MNRLEIDELEKAIELLKERYMTVSMCLTSEECIKQNKALDLAISALEKQLNGGWIPVSERLPAAKRMAKE